jgi:hypothetical protein
MSQYTQEQSQYTQEQKREIMAKARTILAEPAPALPIHRKIFASRRSEPELGSGSGLVFKTREDSRVANDDVSRATGSKLVYKTKIQTEPRESARSTEAAEPSKLPATTSGGSEAWWQWVDKRIDYRLEAFAPAPKRRSGRLSVKSGRRCASIASVRSASSSANNQRSKSR